MLNYLFFRPLPVIAPDRLVVLGPRAATNSSPGRNTATCASARPMLTGMAASNPTESSLDFDGETHPAAAEAVSLELPTSDRRAPIPGPLVRARRRAGRGHRLSHLATAVPCRSAYPGQTRPFGNAVVHHRGRGAAGIRRNLPAAQHGYMGAVPDLGRAISQPRRGSGRSRPTAGFRIWEDEAGRRAATGSRGVERHRGANPEGARGPHPRQRRSPRLSLSSACAASPTPGAGARRCRLPPF